MTRGLLMGVIPLELVEVKKVTIFGKTMMTLIKILTVNIFIVLYARHSARLMCVSSFNPHSDHRR